jgi:hypothetical protein
LRPGDRDEIHQARLEDTDDDRPFPARSIGAQDGEERKSLARDGRAASMETSEGLTGNPFTLFTEWDSEADHKADDRL